MLNEVYNQTLLAYAANISHLGVLEDYDGIAVVKSRICGSQVQVSLKLENGYVVDFAHEVRACALGQASSAIMAELVVGKSVEELKQLRMDMYAFLKERAEPPKPPFEAFACLQPVQEYKNRHASTLLTFDAVVEAIENAS